MALQNKRLLGIVLTVALLLTIPLIANFPWTAIDYVVMGILLLITGLTIELILRKVQNWNYRIGIIALVLFIFFLIWAELAVSIFGSPFAGS
ncbi:MAG: hypothetical protein LPK19_06800 [Hymenobacteraceae bacterium]|nr:hypothetical protein [Hymenobacteraceae bacterium]MDX5395911.1 hypothetical protein [Hymenobacteraceae bacterium]MDX5511968.1 hypothetical protein [Hymenobacteraceae bacterium]